MGAVSQFDWPVRVYYEDTDGGGVVYHANYLKFMERARTEWLRSLGFEQTEIRRQMRIIFVVRGLKLQYLRPANFDDALKVSTRLTKTGRSLLEFEQVILRNDELLTRATIEVVCVDAEQFKPISIPTPIRNAMQMMESE
jgi:acyl-CoA thioester hydrolase